MYGVVKVSLIVGAPEDHDLLADGVVGGRKSRPRRNPVGGLSFFQVRADGLVANQSIVVTSTNTAKTAAARRICEL